MIKDSSVHPLSLELLAKRGIIDDSAVERFLFPDYARDTYDPFGILNMERAVERILQALREGEKFVIYGDYDCDGIPGSVVLYDLFTKIGCPTFSNYIPHRHHEGYGLNKDAIAKFAKDGIGLVITVDCGITDVTQVMLANELGIDVIITDHHLPQAVLPPAYAILNSKQDGDTYQDNMLCGAGVAFKLAQAILLRGKFTDIPAGWEKWLLDMAGLSTIADMVPLQNENRVLAYYGLKVLRKSPRPGLHALLAAANVDQRYLTEEDVGFTIGPRINAASRMDVPFRAFELLATRDVLFAKERALFLDGLNDERKQEVARMTKEAKRVLEKREMRAVIVVGNPSWRVGVAGIVANQLAETYDRPAFVWGKEGSTMIKGSCRSDGRVNMVELMIATREGVFTQKGGHEFSGGFTVDADAIHFLEDALVEAHLTMEKKEKVAQVPDADKTLSLSEVNEEIFQAVDALAPFGVGNPKPVFSFPGVTIVKAEQFGKTRNHLKLTLSDLKGAPGKSVQAIAFFATPDDYPNADVRDGARVTVLGTFEKSYFRGRPELRLRILDIIAA
jgi:single-stranded-DNA-specific exonuclease